MLRPRHEGTRGARWRGRGPRGRRPPAPSASPPLGWYAARAHARSLAPFRSVAASLAGGGRQRVVSAGGQPVEAPRRRRRYVGLQSGRARQRAGSSRPGRRARARGAGAGRPFQVRRARARARGGQPEGAAAEASLPIAATRRRRRRLGRSERAAAALGSLWRRRALPMRTWRRPCLVARSMRLPRGARVRRGQGRALSRPISRLVGCAKALGRCCGWAAPPTRPSRLAICRHPVVIDVVTGQAGAPPALAPPSLRARMPEMWGRPTPSSRIAASRSAPSWPALRRPSPPCRSRGTCLCFSCRRYHRRCSACRGRLVTAADKSLGPMTPSPLRAIGGPLPIDVVVEPLSRGAVSRRRSVA